LALKHLVAVQAALEALTGQSLDDDFCIPLVCTHADHGTTLEAAIRVDLVTNRIQSCGGCKGCGGNRRRRGPLAGASI